MKVTRVAVPAVLALLLSSCPPPVVPPEVPENSHHLGRRMTITGDVDVLEAQSGERVPFTGSRAAAFIVFTGEDFADFGGTGGIENGRLDFTVGTPVFLAGGELFNGYCAMFSDFTVAPPDFRWARLNVLTTQGEGLLGTMHRYAHTCKDGTEITDEVSYIFVDRNVSVTGGGLSVYDAGGTARTESVSITLLAGWNAVHMRSVLVHTDEGSTQTVTMSAVDPDWVNWLLWESDEVVEEG